ncbi:MAG: hypothetical protein EXS03_03780 [Phycisphaerales bacterium]|nr:hypothetical protein [Phycisphaerales bacterium]
MVSVSVLVIASALAQTTGPTDTPVADIPATGRIDFPPAALDAFESIAQPRQSVAEKGIQFNVNLTVDGGYNLTGGVQAGGFVAGLVTGTVALDAEKLAGISGGSFVATWSSFFESNPGPYNLIPDWWGYEGISTGFGDINEVGQCYYQQQSFDDAVTLVFGKQDACNNFTCPLGSQCAFINTMAYYPTTLVPYLPSYPDQAMGLVAVGRPTKSLALKVGWFDGTNVYSTDGTTPKSTGSLGPGTFFDNPGSWFYITQAEFSWNLDGGLDGSVAAGGWWQTGPSVPRGASSPTPLQESDLVDGFYVQATQRVFNPDPTASSPAGLQVFGQFGWSSPSVNPSPWSLMGGLVYTGLLPGREADSLGVALGYAAFSDSPQAFQSTPGLYELAFEAYYRIAITKWMSLQPDLQVIVTPGLGEELPTAVVGIMRLSINF